MDLQANYLIPAVPSSRTTNSPYEMLVHAGCLEASKNITFNANNTSQSIQLFAITGTVEILCIHGILTAVTTFTNHTGGNFHIYDGTNTAQLTGAAGSDMSGFGVGSVFLKSETAATNLTVANSDQCRLIESTSPKKELSPFLIVGKNGVTTYIQYSYATTDAPQNATATVYVKYLPYNGGTLTAA